MPKIVSANLSPQAWKIKRRLDVLRKGTWFSKWVSNKIIDEFGDKKKLLITEMEDLDKKEGQILKRKKEIAKELSRLK